MKYEEGLRDGREIKLLPQEEEMLMADWMDMEEYSNQGPWTEIPLYGYEWDWGVDALSSCLNSDDSFDDTSLVFVARTCQWVSDLGVILYQQQALMQNKPNCSSKSTANPI